MTGKCPKCETSVSTVTLEAVDIKYKATSYEGVYFLCPSCKSVLSVSFDPIRFAQEVAKEVKKR